MYLTIFFVSLLLHTTWHIQNFSLANFYVEFRKKLYTNPVISYKMAVRQQWEIDGLMQKRRNSSAIALELRFFCIKPSKLYLKMVTISAGFNELNISAGGMHPAKVSRSVRSLLHGRTSPCFYSWTWLGPARDWWVTTIQLILNPLVSALKTTTGQHLMCRVIWRKHKDISLWYISQHGMVQIVEIYAYGWQGPKSFSQYHVCWWPHGARSWIDPAHKSNNTTDKYI